MFEVNLHGDRGCASKVLSMKMVVDYRLGEMLDTKVREIDYRTRDVKVAFLSEEMVDHGNAALASQGCAANIEVGSELSELDEGQCQRGFFENVHQQMAARGYDFGKPGEMRYSIFKVDTAGNTPIIYTAFGAQGDMDGLTPSTRHKVINLAKPRVMAL